MMWFFGNLENPVCQTPLLVPNPKKGSGAASGGFVADPESMMMITSMGFSEKQGKRALRKCDGNLERAVEFVMSHMDDPDTDDDEGTMQVDQTVEVQSAFAGPEAAKNNGIYKLQSFITHLGASIHAGHYVCHAR